MRNRQVHAALAAFCEEAAALLASETAAGHELPFEVVEARGRGETALYCYRPLTGDFILARTSLLGGLPTFLPAVHALAGVGGLLGYLEQRVARGGLPRGPRERAELALRAFLTRTFEDASEFRFDPVRFERAYRELEAIVHEGRTETVVVCPVLGLELHSAEVAMGENLVLARGELLEDAPQDAVWPRGAGGGPDGLVLAVLRWESAPGDEAPLEHARIRLGRLVRALRLFDPAGVALGPAAWTRTAGGPWQTVVLGLEAGRPHGRCVVTPGQEDELRAFCSLVTRRTPRSGELAWALGRFELGCSRRDPAEALTDHLLALRALLEPEGPQSGRLAGRVAALCAEPELRAQATERVASTASLERAVVRGVGGTDPDVLADLVADLSADLRAILRDVLCGHLDPDVRGVADAILAASASEAAPAAGDTGHATLA